MFEEAKRKMMQNIEYKFSFESYGGKEEASQKPSTSFSNSSSSHQNAFTQRNSTYMSGPYQRNNMVNSYKLMEENIISTARFKTVKFMQQPYFDNSCTHEQIFTVIKTLLSNSAFIKQTL
jgi:hypothetical protein